MLLGGMRAYAIRSRRSILTIWKVPMDQRSKILANRPAEKQASRDEDAARLARGEITPAELRAENSFFGSLDMRRFRIVEIGGRPINVKRDMKP